MQNIFYPIFKRRENLYGKPFHREGEYPLLRKMLGILLPFIFLALHVQASGNNMPLPFNKNLPVKITVFTAKYSANNNIVNLHWVTSMEKNNEHFLIERSLDSLHFLVIGKARSSGNSQQAQHYYFDDPKPVGGKMFYRLREIDSSGKQFLTGIISAYKPISQLELAGLSSSDDGNRLNFAVISPKISAANVVVADISGHVFRSYYLNMKEGANLQSIYTGDFKAGVYFLQVNDKNGNGSVMEKFVHKVKSP